MIFEATKLPGVVVVEMEEISDERGFFARTFCATAFAERELMTEIVQTSVAFNRLRGTLRGMHYQVEPERKLVRCSRGAIYDVAIDLRSESPTFCHWTARELTESNHRAMHIPAGCAHGYLTLTDGAEVTYFMDAAQDPALARGVRWNEPTFAIEWPLQPVVISARDAGYSDYSA